MDPADTTINQPNNFSKRPAVKTSWPFLFFSNHYPSKQRKFNTMKAWFWLLILILPVFAFTDPEIKHEEKSCVAFYDTAFCKTYYLNSEEPVRFVGGEDSLRKFILQNIRLPQNGQCFEGTVFLSLLINEKGELDDLCIRKKTSSSYHNNEAVRIAQLLTDWVPAKCSGQPVPSVYYLPVRFVIQ
jgi:hypothetical protein